jgi:hypothetical protein
VATAKAKAKDTTREATMVAMVVMGVIMVVTVVAIVQIMERPHPPGLKAIGVMAVLFINIVGMSMTFVIFQHLSN